MNKKPRKEFLIKIFMYQLALLILFGLLMIVFSIFTNMMGSFFFSFIAGGIGGSISLLKRISNQDEAILDNFSQGWVNILLPILNGGIMAGIAYLFFMSGILTGDSGGGLFTSNLFPNFDRPEFNPENLLSVPEMLKIRPSSVEDMGKLLVWCFISGYSERFVPSILKVLEKKAPNT